MIVVFWLIPVIRSRTTYEVYAALGVGIYFSLIPLMWVWESKGTGILAYIGIALIAVGCAFFFTAVATMHHRGAPESGWEETNELVRGGIFGVVRSPVYLGGAISTLGIMMIAQSIPSALMGIFGIFCFWTASRKEGEFNVRKFGDEYSQYMREVPMWNFVSGLVHLRKK